MENEILIKGYFMLDRYKNVWINKNAVDDFIVVYNELQEKYEIKYRLSNQDVFKGPGATKEGCIKELQMFLGVSLDENQFNNCVHNINDGD